LIVIGRPPYGSGRIAPSTACGTSTSSISSERLAARQLGVVVREPPQQLPAKRRVLLGRAYDAHAVLHVGPAELAIDVAEAEGVEVAQRIVARVSGAD
jgi:hypothetical protein